MIKTALIALTMGGMMLVPAQADEKSELGVRLMATMAFVKSYCPEYKPNIILLNAALSKLGTSTDQISKNQGKMLQGELYITALNQNRGKSCGEIWEMFGDDGTAISGFVEKN